MFNPKTIAAKLVVEILISIVSGLVAEAVIDRMKMKAAEELRDFDQER